MTETTKRTSGFVIAFMTVWTLMMLAFTGAMGAETYRRAREFRTFRETPCTILSSSCHLERGTKGGRSYRIESAFEFTVEGRRQVATDRGESLNVGTKEEAEARVAGLAPGTTHPCWYDPTDSTQAVLERRLPRLLPVLPIPFLLAVLGLVLLHHFWTQRPLGRFGQIVCGVAFFTPWLLFAIGFAGSSTKARIFAGVFGGIGAAGLIGTLYHAIRAPAKTRP